MRRSLLLTMIFVSPAVLAAQPPGSPPCTPEGDRILIHGRVTDQSSHAPLQQTTVTFVWQSPRDRRATTKETKTDRAGTYSFCEASAGTLVFVRAKFMDQEVRGGTVPVTEAGGKAEINMTIDAPHAVVTGKVTEMGSTNAVQDAAVSMGTVPLTTTTGPDGTFTFREVPPGEYSVQVRHVSYATLTDRVVVEFGIKTDLNVKMTTSPIELRPIEVETRSLKLEQVGFYYRQQRGIGSFLTREQIQAVLPLQPTDALRLEPGLSFTRRRFGPGFAVAGRNGCQFRYVINGGRVGETFEIDDLIVDWIEAIEIYRGPASVPAEFTNFAKDVAGDCGVMAIWLTNRVRE